MNIVKKKNTNCVTWNLVKERKSLKYLQLSPPAQKNVLKMILSPASV